MRIMPDLTGLIGGTPMLELKRLFPDALARVLAKLKRFIPIPLRGRAVLSRIRAASAEGLVRPGTEVVEARSGNTAIGLAP